MLPEQYLLYSRRPFLDVLAFHSISNIQSVYKKYPRIGI